MSKRDPEEVTYEVGSKPTECGILEPKEESISMSRKINCVKSF